MSPGVLRQCVDPFYTTKGAAGTGMGLAMVYGIMQRHDGSLEVESEEGAGTTVRLWFPSPRDEDGIQVLNDTPVGEAPSGLRVLVVDDDPRVREVTTEYLVGDGNDVETAGDGVEALQIYSTGTFDLVITDWAMPEMNGDELALAIKERTPGARIIMLTGFGSVMGRAPDGVDAVVSKPVTLARVRQAVVDAMAT